MFGITEDEVADLSPKLKEVLSFRYASQMDINVRRSLACTSTSNAPVGANDPHLILLDVCSISEFNKPWQGGGATSTTRARHRRRWQRSRSVFAT